MASVPTLRLFKRVLQRRSQLSGAGMVEFIIAFPVVLVACLLVLQLMLLYRAKIALNYATQEAARVGAMSNGRIVPRFLTDLTRFSTVFRKKKKCFGSSGISVKPLSSGECPYGSSEERISHEVNTAALPNNAASSDGLEPAGTSGFGGNSASGTPTSQPPDKPTIAAAENAKKSNNSDTAKSFFVSLGKGMIRYGDSSVLQGFINGITPLYSKGTNFLNIANAQVDAYGDAMMNSCILYHNPTHTAFLDFGFMEIEGPDKNVLQIPNDMMRYRVPAAVDPKGKGVNYFKSNGKYLSDEEGGLRGAASSMSVQEANLLSIEIKYSYPLQVPIAREILVGFARLGFGGADDQAIDNAFNDFSLKNGRWPMSSFSTYRMQTPVHWHMFYPFGDLLKTQISPDIAVFSAISSLWNIVSEKVNDKFNPSMPQIGFCPGLLINVDNKNVSDGIKNNYWFGKSVDTK